MFSPGGLVSGGFINAGAAHIQFLVEHVPEDRFSALLRNKDGDVRDLARSAAGGAQPARIEYIDRFADELVERQNIVTCPKIGEAYVCVHLEYLVDDDDPDRHKRTYEKVLGSLTAADPNGPTTPDWLTSPPVAAQTP
jgi:hypothetical protein